MRGVSGFLGTSMKISIVTATWNSGKTVEDTIKSVLCQTYKDYEYLIIDGVSKDDTLEIARRYEPLFEGRMNIFSEKDKGIYDAMNKGLKMATGEVVAILNSDDFFTSDEVLQKVADVFQNTKSSLGSNTNSTDRTDELDAVYGDIHFVKDEDLKKCTRYFSARYFKPWMLRFGFMPPHASFYCRKEIFERYGYYDLQYRTSSDFEMMVRLLWVKKIRTQYVNMDFVTMRAGGESTNGLEAKKKVNRDIAGSLKQHGVYSNQFFQSLRYIWRVGELIYTRIKF